MICRTGKISTFNCEKKYTIMKEALFLPWQIRASFMMREGYGGTTATAPIGDKRRELDT